MLRAVGYEPRHLSWMVVAESAFLVAWGLGAGTACALIAVSPALVERAQRLPAGALAGLIASVAAVALLSSLAAARAAGRTPLLATLRAE